MCHSNYLLLHTLKLIFCVVVVHSLSRVQVFVTPWTVCSPPGSFYPLIFQAKILKWVVISFSRGSFWPRDQTHVSCVFCLAGGFFTTELPGKFKNTGVGCHSLLQGIFQIQGSNPGLLHCRQILYCLSCQGSPYIFREWFYIWFWIFTFPLMLIWKCRNINPKC